MSGAILGIGAFIGVMCTVFFIWRLCWFVHYLYFYTPCNRRGCICKKQGQALCDDKCRIYGAKFKNPEEH